MSKEVLIPGERVQPLLKMAMDIDLDYPQGFVGSSFRGELIPVEHSDFVLLFRTLFRWACNRPSLVVHYGTTLSGSLHKILREVERAPQLEETLKSPTLRIFAQLGETMLDTLKTKSLNNTYSKLAKKYAEEHKEEAGEVFISVTANCPVYYGVSQFLRSFFRKSMPGTDELSRFLRWTEAITNFENELQTTVSELPFLKEVISFAFLTAVIEEFELIDGQLELAEMDTLTLVNALKH